MFKARLLYILLIISIDSSEPYLIFNAQTQLISLITDIGFETPSSAYDQTFATPPANIVNIYINQESFNFFQGMNFVFRNNFVGSTDPFGYL